MIITQESLVRQIAEREAVEVETVRTIFKSAEDIMFNYLSSTAPSEPIIVKLLKGVRLERRYIKKRNYSKGMFQNVDCAEHVNVKADVSKYYSNKINDKLFDSGQKQQHC